MFTGILTASSVYHNRTALAPYLLRMLEPGPSGCLQLAPFTGNHQGAAATWKETEMDREDALKFPSKSYSEKNKSSDKWL